MAFRDFIDYLQLEKHYSPHTLKAYQRDLQSFLDYAREEFEYDDIKSVNYSIVRSWIVALVDSGITNRSVNRKMSSLKTYYKFLMKTGQISENPMVKHRSLKTSKKVQVPFSQKEIDEVIEKLSQETGFEGLRNRLIVELFYATGMRRAELINLKIKDVSLGQGTLKVLGKRNKERILPLLPSIIHTLKQYLEERERLDKIVDVNYLLLSKKGVKLYETFVYRIINSYFREASEKVKR